MMLKFSPNENKLFLVKLKFYFLMSTGGNYLEIV